MAKSEVSIHCLGLFVFNSSFGQIRHPILSDPLTKKFLNAGNGKVGGDRRYRTAMLVVPFLFSNFVFFSNFCRLFL